MPIRPALLVLLALGAACASASPAAQKAQNLLDRGDYRGADRLADAELEERPKDGDLWRVKIRAALGENANARAVAAYAKWRSLRGSHDPQALRQMAKTVLWQGLEVPSGEIRARAVRAVERLQLEELAEDVFELVADPDDVVAATAAVAVLRSHPHAPKVATDVLQSGVPRARAIAVRGIAEKVGAMTRADIVPLAGDESPEVRRAVVAALAALGEREDRDRLEALARQDEDGGVRAAALRALTRWAEDTPLALARDGLGDPYRGARLAAVQLLAARGDEEALSLLEGAAGGDHLHVAFRALVALRNAGAEPPVERLERGLTDGDWTVRAAALNALVEAAPRQDALRLAGGAIVDAKIEVRQAAARVLLRLGQRERARREFAKALGAERASVRLSAATDLARMDDPRGLETLAELAREGNADIRAAAVRAHRVAGRPTGGLVAALADDAAGTRVLAAEVLLDLL